MNLPSLQFIRDKALETFERFPFALLSAIVGTGAVLVLAQNNFTEGAQYRWLYNAWLVGFLGISLFVIAQLRSETAQLSRGRWLSLNVSVMLVLIAYYAMLPSSLIHAPQVHLFRFLFMAAAAHFFVAVVPFGGAESDSGFWEFNKSLFLRFISAWLYTHVLFVGLMIAMVAVDQLFSVTISPRRYMQLWYFLVGIFNTWFFLSGIPRDVNAKVDYPKGLKVFTQYVLIPLVVVYFLILYAYMAKIVIEWDWPKGWVGYLVLGFSTTGIFSLLIVHPIKDSLENRWLSAFTERFYLAIFPPAILLLLAISRRVSEYGLTENRYIVIVLGIWLLFIALYFTLSRGKSIKMIPVSLGILALAASVGPWGASAVSRVDQVGRLEGMLTANQILVGGKIVPAKDTISFNETRQISSIVRYVVEVHGKEALQPWFAVPLDSIEGNAPSRYVRTDETAEKIVSLLGLNYVKTWDMNRGGGVKALRGPAIEVTMERSTIALSGDEFVVGPLQFDWNADTILFRVDNSSWSVISDSTRSKLVFSRSGGTGDKVEFVLSDLLRRLVRAHKSIQFGIEPADSLMMMNASSLTRIRLVIRSLTIGDNPDGPMIRKLTFDAYLRKR